ncbi:MAG: hypothetical protein ACRD1R_11805 [Acidobacteriota bacterium]
MRTGLFLSLLLAVAGPLLAYDIKKIDVKPAAEYPARQDFQNIVIGVYPCETEQKASELFDTDKLHEEGYMPVLVVVENNNEFAIRLHEREIFFIRQDGINVPSVPFHEVILGISMKRKLSSVPTRPEILIQQVGNKDMVQDFEQKAFGERLIPPHSSDYGVVFFPLSESNDLAGTLLYFPEVLNITDDEQLMFFEVALGGRQE